MTEDAGFPEPELIPVADQKAAGVPPDAVVTIADQKAGTPPPDLPAEPVAEVQPDPPAPDPVPDPWIPETEADWRRNLFLELHRRLRNAGY